MTESNLEEAKREIERRLEAKFYGDSGPKEGMLPSIYCHTAVRCMLDVAVEVLAEILADAHTAHLARAHTREDGEG